MKLRLVLGVVLAAAVFQLILWLADGRKALSGDTFLADLAHDRRSEREGELEPPATSYRYLLLCDELIESLEPAGIARAEMLLAEATGSVRPQEATRLLAQREWRGQDASRGCWCARPVVNTPLVAKVDCDDGCTEIAMHGHSHYLLYLLGKWFVVKTTGEWAS